MESKKHFVFVHGAGHGAWCWYKLVSLISLAGHQVSALDLAACGINPNLLHGISSLSEYVNPLMEFMATVSAAEKIIWVGHSYGGNAISFAMENFPEKILASVFVAANIPNFTDPPATLVQEFWEWTSKDNVYDYRVYYENGPDNPPTSDFLGPEYLARVIYTHCSREDLELAKLVRPIPIFLNDLSKKNLLTAAKFESVDRIFM